MVNLKIINKEDFGKLLLPEKIYKFKFKKELEKVYQKLYFDNLNYKIITNIFALTIILGLVIYVLSYELLYPYLSPYYVSFVSKVIVVFLNITIFNFFIFYSLLFLYFLRHESKFRAAEQEIEADLPEFIDNLVSNLKGGISLEKALVKSVRIEQKALLHEVTLINQKIMMGSDVYDALKEFRLRFDSPIINRTFFLIEEGIKGGGNIAKPLERISQNLKRIYTLNEEIIASSGGFAMVIRAITILVAPLLFALAITLLTFIGNLFQLILKTGADQIPVSTIPDAFSDYLVVFSYAMIFLIIFFSSLITAELKNEKIHEAIKYLPFYIAAAMTFYWIFSEVLLSFFGSVI